jgi:hypothetical protein
MPQQLSSQFIEAVNASETDEAFLVLLTITHAELPEPIRVTSDSVETVSQGNTFVPFPFKIALPEVDSDSSGILASIEIDGVDPRIVKALRKIQSYPMFKVEVVLASSPDTIEVTWPQFKLSNAKYDAQSVTGDLVLELLDQVPFPSGKFDPARFPGLF